MIVNEDPCKEDYDSPPKFDEELNSIAIDCQGNEETREKIGVLLNAIEGHSNPRFFL